MKNKHILSVLLIGVIVMVIGSLFKIMHWPGASVLVIVGTLTKVVALLVLIGKILSEPKYKEFLDS